MQSPKVFLSHRSVDKDRVEPIASALRAKGIDAWLDKWEIRPGDSIVEKINAALEQCDAALIFLSVTALESAWVTAEANALTHQLIEEGKRLIPVLLDAEAPVPPLLRDLTRCLSGSLGSLPACAQAG